MKKSKKVTEKWYHSEAQKLLKKHYSLMRSEAIKKGIAAKKQNLTKPQ